MADADAAPIRGLIGQSLTRIEDRPLVTGRGRFLDDLHPPGCLIGAFLRSPHAHARLHGIDTSAARAMPGVVAVLTADDLAPLLRTERLEVGLPSGAIRHQLDRPVLARGEVVHVGEPVALVLATDRARAEDAAEAVEVSYQELPAVAALEAALAGGAPPVHAGLSDNLLAEFGFAYGDCDRAFASAALVVAGRYDVHRGGAMPMEGRGVLARPDPVAELLEVWSSTQTPAALKQQLARMLGRDEDGLRVRAPDLGGGFGPKLVTYPEEIAVAAAALALGRPVKWVEDRQEHFTATTQERDQIWTMELAVDAAGRILGLRGDLLHDHGAYTARGLNVPYGSGITLPLPYNVPAYRLDIRVALTNKTPVTPVRGAGQPQAALVMERLLDRAAARLGLERESIRARNLVTPAQMPCEKPLKLRSGGAVVLDSGDYPQTQRRALEAAGWDGFGARQAAARREGRRLGIGLANYVEGTGRGPYETVNLRLTAAGRIRVSSGAAAMGQGTASMLAQIVADRLGGDLSLVDVVPGDTSDPLGFGGFNSRQTVVAGASAHAAAEVVRKRLLNVAAHLMEVAEDDLEIAGDRVGVRGVPGMSRDFGTLARAAAGLPGFRLPGIDTPGLGTTERVVIDDMAYSNGCAVAEVEVDDATGGVRLLRFTLAHDCGRMINPMLVDGQILGGIAQGIGNALFEQLQFDAAAQPLTTTLADYVMVTAAEMPAVEILHGESPSPLNALGVKGVGESGVIPAAPAILSAIDDALGDLDLHIDSAPLTPQGLRARIRAAAAGSLAR